ncbi:carotenoid biosynthesis protein [bacterium]|nr:carotenoid biosynthesis protein [bacterium]
MLDSIIITICKRPYVFLFLLTYLFLSIKREGLRNSLVFLFVGYLIAWISEASSIRTGFPYGWYFYKYQNMPGELFNFGVPVWDSVSYVFLTYAGLRVAEFSFPQQLAPFKKAWLAAFFTTLLDVIVDPLAHMGGRWFLGDIYYYPNPGFYFNVPLSNFAGWLLVSFCIAWAGLILRKPYFAPVFSRLIHLGGIGLYTGVFLFNLLITLWIKDYFLALCSTMWFLIPAFFIFKEIKKLRPSSN